MSNKAFDPEVVALMRYQFDQGDKDASGELDSAEAAEIFSRHFNPHASDAEVKRMTASLKNEIDSDRNGRISFDEYCFRFGRRYQMDAARTRRRRTGNPAPSYSTQVNSATWVEDNLQQARMQANDPGSHFFGSVGGVGPDQLLVLAGCVVMLFMLGDYRMGDEVALGVTMEMIAGAAVMGLVAFHVVKGI